MHAQALMRSTRPCASAGRQGRQPGGPHPCWAAGQQPEGTGLGQGLSLGAVAVSVVRAGAGAGAVAEVGLGWCMPRGDASHSKLKQTATMYCLRRGCSRQLRPQPRRHECIQACGGSLLGPSCVGSNAMPCLAESCHLLGHGWLSMAFQKGVPQGSSKHGCEQLTRLGDNKSPCMSWHK